MSLVQSQPVDRRIFNGDSKTMSWVVPKPGVRSMQVGDRKDTDIAVAEKIMQDGKRIVTGRDILGEDFKDIELKPENFSSIYTPNKREALRRYALHQQKLENITKLVAAERCSNSIQWLAIDLFNIGEPRTKTNRFFADLHLNEEAMKHRNFATICLQHAKVKNEVYDFIVLGVNQEAFNKLAENHPIDKFFDAAKKGVVLDPRLEGPLKISDKEKFKAFRSHLKAKNFTHVILGMYSGTRETFLEAMKNAEQVHWVIAKKLSKIKFAETPLLEFLRDQEQFQTLEGKSESFSNAASALSIRSTVGLESGDLSTEQMLDLAGKLLEEDKGILSTQDFYDCAKFAFASPQVLYNVFPPEQYKKFAEHAQKIYDVRLLCQRELHRYNHPEVCIAISEFKVGQCQEKAMRAFVKARLLGIKDITLMRTNQNGLFAQMLNSKQGPEGHIFILLGVKKSEIQSLLEHENDPIEFLKKLKKGVILDPFFNIACRVTDEKAWQAILAYNQAYLIDSIDTQKLQYGIEMSQEQAKQVMEDGRELHQKVLERFETEEFPECSLMTLLREMEEAQDEKSPPSPKKTSARKSVCSEIPCVIL